jgi:hypothetical protein
MTLTAAARHAYDVTRSKTGDKTHLSAGGCSVTLCGVTAPRIIAKRADITEARHYAHDIKGAQLCGKCFPARLDV